MRLTSFLPFRSEYPYSGLDLASSVPSCTFNFFSKPFAERGSRTQSPPPPPSSTPLPIISSPEDEEAEVEVEVDTEDAGTTLINSSASSDDLATNNSFASTNTADRDVFAVYAKYPLVIRSSRWYSEATSIIVRREASLVTTCTVINPIPCGWIPHIPAFSLPRIKLGWLRFPRRVPTDNTAKANADGAAVEKDDIFAHEKESEQDARELTTPLSQSEQDKHANLGWAGVFSLAGAKPKRRSPDFDVNESGRLIVPKLNVNVQYRVTEEVEVYADEDLELLRVMSNRV